MVSKLALGAIWGYQRYISPRKGFRCAHAVLHGGTGCSGFAKYAIHDHGLRGAVPHIRQRFRDCRLAAETLRACCAVHSGRADDPDDDQDGADPQRSRRTSRRRASSCREELAGAVLGAGCCAGTGAGSQTGDPASGSDGGSCLSGECSMPDCTPDCGGCDCAPSCS